MTLGLSRTRRTRGSKRFFAIATPFVAVILVGAMAYAECPALVSANAYGEQVRLLDSDGDTVKSGPLPSAAIDPHTGGNVTKSVGTVDLPGLLKLTGVEVHAQSANVGTQDVVTNSYAQVGGANIGDSDIVATVIRSECQADEEGVSGDTTLAGLAIEGQGGDLSPDPNTTIEIPGVLKVVLNEQQTTDNKFRRAITVNAIHVYLFPGNPMGSGDIIIASSHCDIRKNQTA